MRDEDAYVGFVSARWSALYRLAYLMTASRPAAEALLGTALTKTYVDWPGLPTTDAPDAHVHRVMLDSLVGPARRSWRRRGLHWCDDLDDSDLAEVLGCPRQDLEAPAPDLPGLLTGARMRLRRRNRRRAFAVGTAVLIASAAAFTGPWVGQVSTDRDLVPNAVADLPTGPPPGLPYCADGMLHWATFDAPVPGRSCRWTSLTHAAGTTVGVSGSRVFALDVAGMHSLSTTADGFARSVVSADGRFAAWLARTGPAGSQLVAWDLVAMDEVARASQPVPGGVARLDGVDAQGRVTVTSRAAAAIRSWVWDPEVDRLRAGPGHTEEPVLWSPDRRLYYLPFAAPVVVRRSGTGSAVTLRLPSSSEVGQDPVWESNRSVLIPVAEVAGPVPGRMTLLRCDTRSGDCEVATEFGYDWALPVR